MKLRVEFTDHPITELDRLSKVVAGVDMDEQEGDPCRCECLTSQVHHQDRVLAAREQKYGSLELSRDFPHEEDGLGLKLANVGVVTGVHLCSAGAKYLASRSPFSKRFRSCVPWRRCVPMRLESTAKSREFPTGDPWSVPIPRVHARW